ncbi:MAG TPA: FAD-dependent oxidoreductase, partial [Micromonosporaceae bacterium]
MTGSQPVQVLIVGGGFAGVGCAKRLAGDPRARVTLFDSNGFHQFQPLLYQVATAELTPADIAFDLEEIFRRHNNVTARMAEATAIDPNTRAVTLADGDTFTGDFLVLA